MTSFVASQGHQHPQYCSNVIHSVYIWSSKKVWRSGYWKSAIEGTASWFFSDFVRICAVYQWVIHIISDFVLSYKYNSWAKQHCPTHSVEERWGQNVVDCSCFLNFEGCIIATQIHWKMLMVVKHIPFLSWIYNCPMFVKLYVTVMYQCVYGHLIPIMLRIVY